MLASLSLSANLPEDLILETKNSLPLCCIHKRSKVKKVLVHFLISFFLTSNLISIKILMYQDFCAVSATDRVGASLLMYFILRSTRLAP